MHLATATNDMHLEYPKNSLRGKARIVLQYIKLPPDMCSTTTGLWFSYSVCIVFTHCKIAPHTQKGKGLFIIGLPSLYGSQPILRGTRRKRFGRGHLMIKKNILLIGFLYAKLGQIRPLCLLVLRGVSAPLIGNYTGNFVNGLASKNRADTSSAEKNVQMWVQIRRRKQQMTW